MSRALPLKPHGRNGDTVEISGRAATLTNLQDVRNQRAQRTERAREEIAKQTYETEHKIDVTVERVFADLSALDLLA